MSLLLGITIDPTVEPDRNKVYTIATTDRPHFWHTAGDGGGGWVRGIYNSGSSFGSPMRSWAEMASALVVMTARYAELGTRSTVLVEQPDEQPTQDRFTELAEKVDALSQRVHMLEESQTTAAEVLHRRDRLRATMDNALKALDLMVSGTGFSTPATYDRIIRDALTKARDGGE
jgi:hypothetical protein